MDRPSALRRQGRGMPCEAQAPLCSSPACGHCARFAPRPGRTATSMLEDMVDHDRGFGPKAGSWRFRRPPTEFVVLNDGRRVGRRPCPDYPRPPRTCHVGVLGVCLPHTSAGCAGKPL